MNKAQIDDLFSRAVASCIDPDGAFRKKVEGKINGSYTKDIVIKLGIDPTRPDIHLGHAVILHKLRAFQEAGCKVIFLIGDYTSLIGDPTGKSKTRPEVTQHEIETNLKTYLEQVGKILRTEPSVFSWMRNSDWFLNVTDIEAADNTFLGKATAFENTRMQRGMLGKEATLTFSFLNVLSVLRHITHARLIERDMFQDRLKNGGELYMHEMLYPVLQGIDSTALATIYGSCDLEIGGTDQTFNMLMGRDVMRMNKQEEQAVMSLDILEGLDGKEKMSKSLDNYISITDEPNDMYGKVLSIPDPLIVRYLTLATMMSADEIKTIEKELSDGKSNPKDHKMRLAREVVAMYHGGEAANTAEKNFVDTFSEKKIPEDVPEISDGYATMLDALMSAGVAESKTEARRLIGDGAVTHLESDTKMKDPAEPPQKGTYKVGKLRFFKIK
ncbi:MAG: tyrosine--tRNA ligase [Candidatus Pacebacteria bacterium]|nr:tyrosine--tRNA ligase [Candidatus Paceibacterota bacterium]